MRRKYALRQWLMTAIILELGILLSLTGVVYAKYVAEKRLEDSMTIHAALGRIEVYEHQAINKNNSGQYELDTFVTVSQNEYDTVIPGLDIPKDPWVEITKKTEIPAYVFLIVSETNWPDTMTYELEEHWKPLSGYAHVYVYSDPGNGYPIKVTGNIAEIKVIKDDTVTVSQKYTGPKEAKLTFSARMGQVAVNGDQTDMTPNDVYSYIKLS